MDGGALRTYRHAPNTGPRKSWAAGDATSRGVWLALHSLREETGSPSALSAKQWGFQEVLFRGREITLARPLASYVMENILFKVSYPAEFHAQTAVEAAVQLHPEVKERLDTVERIEIETQEAGMRIIDKTGPLANPADRDHCLQYMVAVALLKGGLSAGDYEDETAADLRIDELRQRMRVVENERFTRDYLDAEKRSIANAVRVFFRGGSSTGRIEVEYPLGHRRRRAESIPALGAKFARATALQMAPRGIERILSLFDDPALLTETPVHEFMDLWTT
jgi:2-methylcitrate dehydratase